MVEETRDFCCMSAIKHKYPNSSNIVDQWVYAHQENSSSQDRKTLENSFRHSVYFYRALLRKYLPDNKNANILDLPCGEGRIIYALKVMGYQNISGYDLDKARLETAKKLDLPVNEGDVFQVLEDCEDNSIDCIFSVDFLEHLQKYDVIHFLEMMCRKITSDGVIIVRIPSADSPLGIQAIYNDFTHKWGATSGVLRRLLCAAGFSVISIFGEEPNLAMRFGLCRVLSL